MLGAYRLAGGIIVQKLWRSDLAAVHVVDGGQYHLHSAARLHFHVSGALVSTVAVQPPEEPRTFVCPKSLHASGTDSGQAFARPGAPALSDVG